jgi:hypothetical protein
MRRIFVLLVPAVFALAADVYQAPSPEPTPEETLILEFINRCRADPTADADRIAPAGSEPRLPSSTTIDFPMFRSEMAAIKPSQPLVFDLRLLEAARKHAHYMILNGLGHTEDPDKPGFTGTDPSARLKAAGWLGGGGENCFRDAADPWGSHVGFVVDWGPGGPGGMQPGRGHRTNITNPSYTCIGVGALPNESRLSVTHNLGSDGKRYAGGVVYVDRDRDGWYGLGEGRGGVTVQSGTQRITTWASGAFAIEIPAGATTLTLKAGGTEITRPVPATPGNVKIDWIIPQAQDLAAADKLLAVAEAAKDPTSTSARKARIALLVGAEALALDDARATRVHELTAELSTALTADRAAVREALGGDGKGLKKRLDELAKPWKGTAAAGWFDEAELFAKANAAAATVPADAAPSKLRGVAKELRALVAKSDVAEFRSRLEALARTAEARLDAATRGK